MAVPPQGSLLVGRVRAAPLRHEHAYSGPVRLRGRCRRTRFAACHRPVGGPAGRRQVLVGVMTAMAVVQTVVPGVMPHLERAPHGPWWRVVTALLVQTSGWGQLAFNLAALAVVAPVAERRLGAVWMPVVFLLSGVAAHVVSTVGWSVHGGGDSVGICGLVGALATSYALSLIHIWRTTTASA